MIDARCTMCVNCGAAYCDECAERVFRAHAEFEVGGYISYAGRMRSTVKRGDDETEHRLPVWAARDGSLRIGLPVDDPQHSGDMRQIVTSVSELLKAVGVALANKAC